MFFRTAKQKLGLQECQSRSIVKQKAHFYFVFLSYTYLQIECHAKKAKNVEEVLKELRPIKSGNNDMVIRGIGQFFEVYA